MPVAHAADSTLLMTYFESKRALTVNRVDAAAEADGSVFLMANFTYVTVRTSHRFGLAFVTPRLSKIQASKELDRLRKIQKISIGQSHTERPTTCIDRQYFIYKQTKAPQEVIVPAPCTQRHNFLHFV